MAGLAEICILTVKNLPLDKTFKGLFQSLLPSDVDTNGHKMFLFLRFVRAALTIELIAQHPFKGILDDIVSSIGLQKSLYFLHQLIVELIGVRLDHGIDGYAFVRDERLAKFPGGDASSVAVLHPCEYLLELEDLVLGGGLAVLFAVDGHEVLSEMREHEKLLGEAVYVASCS